MLPDGRTLRVGAERYHVAEHFFTEQAIQSGVQRNEPLQKIVMSSIHEVDSDHHKELIRNVVVTGGGSLLLGFLERLDIELRLAAKASTLAAVASQAHRLQLVYGGPLERKFGAWIGGSLVGSMVRLFALLTSWDM